MTEFTLILTNDLRQGGKGGVVEDVYLKCYDIATKIGGLDDDEFIDPFDSLTHDLGFDSLDQIELVMSLEDEFDFDISDETAESFCKRDTLSNIASAIEDNFED